MACKSGTCGLMLLLTLLCACSGKPDPPLNAGNTGARPPAGVATASPGSVVVATTIDSARATATPSATATPARGASPAASPARRQNAQSADWPVYAYDPQRSGDNTGESVLTPASVAGLRRAWTQTLPELVGGSPILLSGLQLADGSTADLLYVTTTHGSTLAVNAATGAVVWRQDTGALQVNSQACQVCATPAANPSRQWVYAAGNDAAVHRFNAVTGQEDTASPWPVPVTLMNGYEKRSSALNVANGYLYVAVSGYFGDFGPYDGHVLAIHLPDGAAQVFNVLCSDQHRLLAPASAVPGSTAACSQREAGVWARAGVVVDQSGGPADGSLYFASGNGRYDANAGGVNYGDSVLRVSGDATRLLDSYTPASYQTLDDRDLDLGSTAPALLPLQQRSSTPYLAVQGGKDGVLRLLDRTHMGGLGGGLQAINLNQGQVLTSPAMWRDPSGGDPNGDNDWVFVVTQRVTVGYRVVTDQSGASTLREVWRLSQGGSSPVMAGGVLYLTDGQGVSAHDPRSGQSLWSSSQPSAGGNIGGNHWQTPIVVNGRLYIADQNARLTCYALPQP